jgi:serpin B
MDIMENYGKLMVAASAVLMLCGCSSNSNEPDDPTNQEQGSSNEIAVVDLPAYTNSISLTSNEKVVNEGINEFSFKLFDAVVSNKEKSAFDNSGNVSISPIGLALCTGLFANAVDDETANKIVNIFSKSDLDSYNNACKKLLEYLPNEINGAEMVLANSAWLSNQYKFTDSYKKELNSVYYSEVYDVDFNDSSVQSVIDKWCSTKTKGTINNLPVPTNSETQYVLLNAMYFKGDWQSKFDKANTTEKVFYGSSAKSKINMMQQELNAVYFESNNFAAVKLPYNGGGTEMVIVLPAEGADANEFARTFDYASWQEIGKNASIAKVDLSLPKFNIAQTTNLTTALGVLGIPMSDINLAKACNSISGAPTFAQNTYSNIDEEGTTIAAITENMMASTPGTSATEYKKVTMNVNRPFLYFVYNTTTGSILMAGSISNL